MYGITNPTAHTSGRLAELIESGRVQPLIEDTFPLEDLRSAQAHLLKRTHVGKCVVIP
ncbi:zinc-binding dehydrogenase [Streptomyces sp. NPDC047042]|uniref:zinc-binding dehydrogenase n=1 Tax=Streptomyces sp. NPDC047042 TaxID=3154807 RepID=UPI00340689F7